MQNGVSPSMDAKAAHQLYKPYQTLNKCAAMSTIQPHNDSPTLTTVLIGHPPLCPGHGPRARPRPRAGATRLAMEAAERVQAESRLLRSDEGGRTEAQSGRVVLHGKNDAGSNIPRC